jgi:hypothetical protein
VIETWQYVALVGIVVATIAVLSYRGRGMAARESAFLSALETSAATVLAAHRFVLTSKPKPRYGGQYWHFARAPRAIRLYWDFRDRQITVERREGEPPTLARKEIARFSIPVNPPPERYQRALDEVLEAIDDAVKADERVT